MQSIKNKRGYLFTGDVIVAMTLLSLGMILLFYNFTVSNQNTYFTEKLSSDILNILSYTKLSDLCNPTTNLCPNYNNLTVLIASAKSKGNMINYNDDLLSFISYLIEADIASAVEVKRSLHEIFVTNRVVDRSRFGFSLLYRAGDGQVLDIYNMNNMT